MSAMSLTMRVCVAGRRRAAIRRSAAGNMDERATFLIPDRGLDSGSYTLEVEVLDGMPSSVRPFFQGVVDDVGPDDGRFEDPAVGKVPA